MKKFNILIIFLINFVVLTAQPLTGNKYDVMIETAEMCAENHDYINAIEWFQKAYTESKDPNLQVAIGDMYMLLRDYARAEKTYDRVLKKDKKDEFYEVRLDYARSLKYQGKYKEAMTELTAFVSTIDQENLKNDARRELRGILQMDKYPENIEVALSYAGEQINSASSESSPAFYQDGSIYFTAQIAKAPVVLDGTEKEYHAKLYSTAKNPDGQFAKPKELDESINRLNFYNTGVSFSNDGQKMYFTRVKFNNNKMETSEIYVSKRQNNNWTPPYPIDAVNAGNRSIHPYEGELFGERVLFFVSDMPGGQGGNDIYYSSIKGDTYGNPVNLGNTINTPQNEETPYYKEGFLYFSSNGHPGMGGFDIFYSEWDGSKWSEATNIGFNYNSPYDDSFLRFNESGALGALVSNRPHQEKKKFKGTESCCDDIFLIQIRDLIIDLKVLVNSETGPLEGASLNLTEGPKKITTDTKINTLSNDFRFLLDTDKNYEVYVTREGYYPDTFSFNTVGIIDDYTVSKVVTLKAKPEGPKRIVKRNEPILLKSIFFEFNDDKILEEAEKDLGNLRNLMNKYPDMIIELSSHTDSRGSNSFNEKLSQRRANSTKNWLVEEGIAANRIQAVGYGETKLLNRCKDGVNCSEEQHQLNRRSEFKIIAGPQTIEITEDGN